MDHRHESLTDAAGSVTVPVESCSSGTTSTSNGNPVSRLFDAFASTEKTLHANPGAHREVPAFELDGATRCRGSGMLVRAFAAEVRASHRRG
ncbi:MAG TPA: hypothetical protein VGD71_22900 [Kribbella sp.]